jgi:hypothetical protein
MQLLFGYLAQPNWKLPLDNNIIETAPNPPQKSSTYSRPSPRKNQNRSFGRFFFERII